MADKNKSDEKKSAQNDQVAVVVGGPYVENEDHVPATTDLYAQFHTHGLGADDHDPNKATPVFRVGRAQALVDAAKHVAERYEQDVVQAVDRVVFTVREDFNDAEDRLKAAADAILADPVVVGDPSPVQQAAAEETAPVDSEPTSRKGNIASRPAANDPNAGNASA